MAANRIWIDLETTGTDETAPGASVLEVAVVATTAEAEYRELAHQSWVVQHLDEFPLDEVAREMHTKSGLIHEIPFGSPLCWVEAELCRFIQFFGNPAPGREPMAGFSPHFDRRWLERHLPRAAGLFGFRLFDSSTLIRFARDLGYPIPYAKDTAHRALADVRASIQLARDVARALHRR